MAKQNKKGLDHKFENLAIALTKFSGSTTAFITAFGLIVVWLISGPFFKYSDVWQLAINTGTTIITFLMVFLIQRGQNKDSLAIQLKLNELIASVQGASNRLIEVEDLSESDLKILKKHFHKLTQLVASEENLNNSHSIEEAENKHSQKSKNKKR